jgi:hypothetical protein
MGTGTFDKVIGFLIRTIANAWRNLASLSWPIYSGKMTSYHYKNPIWGCDYGEYRYKYSVDGGLYRGIYREPYFVGRDRDVQKSDSIGIEIQVRVCPKDPTKSVLDDF